MRMMRNVLFITGEYPPMIGGVGDYTRLLGQALIERGHTVHVLVAGAKDVAAAPGEPQVVPISGGWGWRSWQRVVRVIGQLQPDVIHLQYQTGAFGMHPAINLLPQRLRRLRSRPCIVVTAHDLRLPYLFPKGDRLRTWVTQRLFDDADMLIVTNDDDLRRVHGQATFDRDRFSPKAAMGVPIELIPIGSNITVQPPSAYERNSWREQLGFSKDTVVLAYFGLLNRSKGVIELLRALALLPARFKLLIIGGSAPFPDDQRYAAEVQAFLLSHQLSERVEVTGPCSAADVSAHLLAADLAVLPFLDGASYRRGSLLAALAHGVPTITTAPQTLLIPPLLDGLHARVVKKTDVTMLGKAIVELAVDEATRAQLATGGRTLAARFAWSSIAAQHETVYHSILGSLAQKV